MKMTQMTRFTKDMAKHEEFYKLHKFLFVEPYKNLSNNARVAYALFRDRMALSIKNASDFTDKDGNIYIIYKRSDLVEILGLSGKTVYRVLGELKKHGLLEEESQYNNLPKRLYLLTPSQLITATADDNRTRKNDRSGIVKMTGPYKSKTNRNKTNNIKNNLSVNDNYNKYNNGEEKQDRQDRHDKTQKKETRISTPPIDCPIDLNFCNKSITLCVENYNHPLDEQTKDLVHYICSVLQSMREGQKSENTPEILELEPHHVALVADSIVRKAENIKNIRKYIEACLTNVKREYSIYLQNACKINPKVVFQENKKNTDEEFFRAKFLEENK